MANLSMTKRENVKMRLRNMTGMEPPIELAGEALAEIEALEREASARVVARPDLLRQVLEAHDSCDQTRIIEAMDAVRDAVYPAIASASNVARREVYVTIARTQYEGYDVMRAFTDKQEAETFVAACTDYPRGIDRPYPDITMPDDEYEVEEKKWMAEKEAWAAAHPAGPDHAGADSYNVIPIPFSDVGVPVGARQPDVLATAKRLRGLVQIALNAFERNDAIDWDDLATALSDTLWLLDVETPKMDMQEAARALLAELRNGQRGRMPQAITDAMAALEATLT